MQFDMKLPVSSELLPIGAAVRMGVPALGQLIDAIRQRGYQVIGPVLRDGAISYGPIENLAIYRPAGHRNRTPDPTA